VRNLWRSLGLLALLGLALTCTQQPEPETTPAVGANELVAAACERALASLAPEPAAGGRTPVAFPVAVGPALRALHGTGKGGDVGSLEAAVDRAARLALGDVGPRVAEAATTFAPADPEALDASSDDALTAEFRAKSEGELRAALHPAAEQRLAESGVREALARVRDGAARLPLPREIQLDPVALVTDQAIRIFFVALASEERQLRKERVARS
jgi:hypothetical protein